MKRLEWPRPVDHLWELEVDAGGPVAVVQMRPGAEALGPVDASEIGAMIAEGVLRGRGFLAVQAFEVRGGPSARPTVYVSVTAQRRRRHVLIAAFASRAEAERHAQAVIDAFTPVLGAGYQAEYDGVPLSRGGSA